MRVTDFEVIDHGIENSQYFQGCGVCFTNFEHVATGIGNTHAEAVSDALDSVAQHANIDGVEALILADLPTSQPISEMSPDAEDDDSEMYYYASIRYNVADDSTVAEVA